MPEKNSEQEPGRARVDLGTLDVVAGAERGAVLELRHPVSGEALDIRIRLLGSDAGAHRATLRVIAQRRMNSASRSAPSQEELEADALELLAGATLGWENVLVDGETLPFSRENARLLYRRFPWIREQVDAFIIDRENFLRD